MSDTTKNDGQISELPPAPEDEVTAKNKGIKHRGKKRKRVSSESSSDGEVILPDNALATERNVHASAVKNNLDDVSVRKILKKVVTNDHVLALVKLREEEEDSGTEDKKLQPKLTRSKVKELKKVSPKSAAWNLDNLELTPIKHIPVKTRPEVKALIAQELPEDEDDDEYEPTHDESDDENTESFSDLDSQPRTPATPSSVPASPQVVKDGPFKVPQEITPSRRKLDLEEKEATIALRTRSKLSLSSTSIEHIEATFVPPDDIPPAVDVEWSEFITRLNVDPPSTKPEDDDDADPEYNVAADQDAQEEDEEALSRSILKISKKELNDLVTELFNIMPEAADEALAENLANSVLVDGGQNVVSAWDGKQEPLSDEEKTVPTLSEKRQSKISIGNSEPQDIMVTNEVATQYGIEAGQRQVTNNDVDVDVIKVERINKTPMLTILPQLKLTQMPDDECIPDNVIPQPVNKGPHQPMLTIEPLKPIQMSIEESSSISPPVQLNRVPPILRPKIQNTSDKIEIRIEQPVTMSPEQVQILQQQLRIHVQLCATNFLQLCVHPVHWAYGPFYKEYLQAFMKMLEKNSNSVVDVCNLKPAMELVDTWEKSVTGDTPENREMIEFVNKEIDRSRRRYSQNSLYVGDFHETFMKVVANSSVFLYPYLLPPMPYRGEGNRRAMYFHSEDELIVLGLDQFWQYVESNPQLYKPHKLSNPRARWGLTLTIELVTKYMFPWMATKSLQHHVTSARLGGDRHNPIYKYFKHQEITPVQHKLLPFNPSITLYEQPEHEMPNIWVRYLGRTSQRFRKYRYRRGTKVTGRPPDGVAILGQKQPLKRPLPIEFTKEIPAFNPGPPEQDKYDIIMNTQAANLFRLVQTTTGSFLLPLENSQSIHINTIEKVITNTVNSTTTVTTPLEVKTSIPKHNSKKSNALFDHCTCCTLLRKILKRKQTKITDYFRQILNTKNKLNSCYCSNIKRPRITSKLKLLVHSYQNSAEVLYNELQAMMAENGREKATDVDDRPSLDDIVAVSTFQLKVLTRSTMTKKTYIKHRLRNLFVKFNTFTSDPVKLAHFLHKTFEVDLLDLYLDFLGFLTAEQADRLNTFKDYFIRNPLKELLVKIDELVTDKEARKNILARIKTIFSDNKSSACEMCSFLLETMDSCPKLAEYTFTLFPHRREMDELDVDGLKETGCNIKEKGHFCCKCKHTKGTVTNNNAEQDVTHKQVDDEADHSSSEDEIVDYEITIEENEVTPTVKNEPPPDPEERIQKPSPDHQSETDDQNTSETQNSSMVIVEFEDPIKKEGLEWKREEDKLILEMLKQQLTPEERKGKPLAKLLEEMNVYEVLAESLQHKSMDDVRERVAYLLSLLVLSESC